MKLRLRRTTLISIGLGSFLAGLALARLGLEVNAVWIWPCLLLLLVSLKQKGVFLIIFITVFGILCGLVRGGQYMRELAKYDSYYGQKITIVGTPTDDGVYA